MEDKYTWENVTISQFEQIVAISGMRKNELDKLIDILSVMTGIESESYLDMTLPQISEEIKKIELLKPELLKKRLKDGGVYMIKGKKYILTPSSNHMTAGQFIDYQNTLMNEPDNITALCSTVLIPENKKYGEGYDVIEFRSVLHEHFPYVDAMGISFFFLAALTELSIA